MQPVTGVINGSKRSAHPKTYFSAGKNKEIFDKLYDFVPPLSCNKSDSEELKSLVTLWDNHSDFINWRRQKMLEFLKTEYELEAKN